MMQILILGAGGQLGQSLQEKLVMTKMNYLALSKQDLDILDKQALKRKLKFLSPSIVINASGFTNVDLAESNKELAFNVNATGPKHLAKICSALNIFLIHLSTDYVFDGCSTHPYKPDDLTSPQNIYGLSKVAGEHAIQEYANTYLIMRTSWVYGEYGNNFLKTMLRLGRTEAEISVVSDQIGSPTYVGDIAKAILKSCFMYFEDSKFPQGLYHYAGLEPCSWLTFSKEIFNAMAKIDPSFRKPELYPILTARYDTAATRPLYSALDSSKFCSQFGLEGSDWRARIPESINKIIHSRN